MERVIMWIMAAGAVVGGMDRIFGNRLKLGERFEQGLLLLGPTALSMVGILCLAPLLSGEWIPEFSAASLPLTWAGTSLPGIYPWMPR